MNARNKRTDSRESDSEKKPESALRLALSSRVIIGNSSLSSEPVVLLGHNIHSRWIRGGS